jgi:glycosyltransferase involved in cell wall biosynthesis
MTPGDHGASAGERTRPSLLMVATVSSTLRVFLKPYAIHFRQLGWRVEAAGNGVSRDPGLAGVFDQLHELPFSRSILDVAGMMGAMRDLARILESGYDIVHVHTPIAAFVTRAAIRRMPSGTRPAAVYTSHGFYFHRGGYAVTNAMFLAAEKLAGRWTDRLVVINEEDYEAARRNRLVSPGHVRLLPGIGIETGTFARSGLRDEDVAQARHGAGLGPGTPLFAVVGELNRNKRPGDAIRALASMRHTEAHLVFLGAGDPARLRALADEKGVGRRVWFTGFIEDVRPIVGSAAALVLASKREGLARSIMEALALEVPVVASGARGNLDLVGNDSGFIVATGDVAALARAMDRILDDPEEARAMGVRGRKRMVERYELSILITHHEALYRELLAERSR